MIALLIIGDEILSGQVADENLPFMIRAFAAAGYTAREVRVIGDRIDTIATTVAELAARHRFVVTSGGVGPTHDDVTHAGVAQAFGVGVEPHPQMVSFLGGRHGKQLPPSVLRMAMLPAGAEVIIDPDARWPIIRKDNCYILPGLPQALRDKIPRLIRLLPAALPVWSAAVYLSAEEILFAEWLEELQQTHRETSIGSYPVVDAVDYRTRISVSGADEALIAPVFSLIEQYARKKTWLVRCDRPAPSGSERP